MATYAHSSQRPMICEVMTDGTGRWRCTPEPYNTPTWFWVLLGLAILGIVGVIGKHLFDEWRWERKWKNRKKGES